MSNNLPDHLQGIVRVPLRSLTAQGFAEIPHALCDSATITQFEQLLANPTQPIYAVINKAQLDSIVEDIQPVLLQDTLKSSYSFPITETHITCLLGQYCIEKAKLALGLDFKCNVKLYYVPSGCNDGEVFRKVRSYMNKDDLVKAQEWMRKLKGRKPFHLRMILGRPKLLKAMDAIAHFTGLWDDLQLGNWAKHLASHCDVLIEHYWKHLFITWTRIFEGVESSPRLLDARTVRWLQYLTPAWSEVDRKLIRNAMSDGLFVNITSERCRMTLLENLLKLDVVIPSILTFDENMRYITIGAKILERHIAIKPKKRPRDDPGLCRTQECLWKTLERDWKESRILETEEGHFGTYVGATHAHASYAAFADVFIAALREFPFRSTVSPLQDVKGQGMIAAPNQDSLSWLCKTAELRGFRNNKTSEGATKFRQRSWSRPTTTPVKLWRGGIPSIRQFWSLQKGFYLPLLSNLDYSESVNPNQACIQRDFIVAFFGYLPRIDIVSESTGCLLRPLTDKDIEENTAWNVERFSMNDHPMGEAEENYPVEETMSDFQLEGTTELDADHVRARAWRVSNAKGLNALARRQRSKPSTRHRLTSATKKSAVEVVAKANTLRLDPGKLNSIKTKSTKITKFSNKSTQPQNTKKLTKKIEKASMTQPPETNPSPTVDNRNAASTLTIHMTPPTTIVPSPTIPSDHARGPTYISPSSLEDLGNTQRPTPRIADFDVHSSTAHPPLSQPPIMDTSSTARHQQNIDLPRRVEDIAPLPTVRGDLIGEQVATTTITASDDDMEDAQVSRNMDTTAGKKRLNLRRAKKSNPANRHAKNRRAVENLNVSIGTSHKGLKTLTVPRLPDDSSLQSEVIAESQPSNSGDQEDEVADVELGGLEQSLSEPRLPEPALADEGAVEQSRMLLELWEEESALLEQAEPEKQKAEELERERKEKERHEERRVQKVRQELETLRTQKFNLLELARKEREIQEERERQEELARKEREIQQERERQEERDRQKREEEKMAQQVRERQRTAIHFAGMPRERVDLYDSDESEEQPKPGAEKTDTIGQQDDIFDEITAGMSKWVGYEGRGR